VYRGGSFYERTKLIRTSQRFDDDPTSQSSYLGFRCARAVSTAE
jgi:formylglycine-generating enzyme required for sulfatase activity